MNVESSIRTDVWDNTTATLKGIIACVLHILILYNYKLIRQYLSGCNERGEKGSEYIAQWNVAWIMFLLSGCRICRHLIKSVPAWSHHEESWCYFVIYSWTIVFLWHFVNQVFRCHLFEGETRTQFTGWNHLLLLTPKKVKVTSFSDFRCYF